MFRMLHNTFVSFSIIFQGFRGRNPKYIEGNVNEVGWLHDFGWTSVKIGTDQGALLVWILFLFWF
jgi:hypothetical protein